MSQIRDFIISSREPDLKNVGWVSLDRNKKKFELKFFVNGKWLPILSNIDSIEPEKIIAVKELIEWIDSNGVDLNGVSADIKANTESIEAEIKRATETEQTLYNKLDEEINRSVSNDKDLLSQIDNEASRATKAEKVLSEKIAAINNSIVYITEEEYDHLININAVQENVEYNIISDE